MRLDDDTQAPLARTMIAIRGFVVAEPFFGKATITDGRTVLRAGGVVLGTGGPTYDRYVRDRNFCEPTEVTRAGFVPTRDAQRCFVGYTCFEPGVGDWFGDY